MIVVTGEAGMLKHNVAIPTAIMTAPKKYFAR